MNDAVTPDPLPRPHRHLKFIIELLVLVIIIVAGITFALIQSDTTQKNVVSSPGQETTQIASQASNTTIAGLQLDTKKDYGNKYANGILPVGDNKYQTSGAKKGYVYTCSGYANNLKSDQAGAQSRGPWFVGTTQYDLNKKAHISGSVKWQSQLSIIVSNDTRTITSNDLPTHPTGTYPVSKTDPAYSYDRNPNSIKSQTLHYELAANPTYGTPNCIGGEVGIMITGAALFNGFDAGGRDAGAWEVQDDCSGHPQVSGEYHYHTLTSCITDTSISTVIGYALDGFPITGPKVGANNILTTDDLDECHGIVSKILLDKKEVTMYHYVMTQDFPYSISCYRGTATQAAPNAEQQQSNNNVPPPPRR